LNEPLKIDYTFLKGAVLTSELVVISAVVDGLASKSPTQLYGWLGDGWYDLGTYGWNTCGLCVLEETETIICISDFGEVSIAKRGGIRTLEKIGTEDFSPKKFGKLRTVSVIDGAVVAGGVGRQVYVRGSENNWKPLGSSNFTLESKLGGFEGIDGFSLKNIYGVGWNGEIWHYDSKIWTRKSSPTNQMLTAVCCSEDGNVYICGRRGLVIVGKDDLWKIIDQQETIEDFWSVVWFDDKLYLSTMRAVYTVSD